MINALMCVHKAGDVISFALEQLIAVPEITRILVADGPTLEPAPCGKLVDTPIIRDVVQSFNCKKILHKYTKRMKNRATKCNHILGYVTRDCKWILVVDADEVYHEDDLTRLVAYLRTTEWEIFKLNLINLLDDFNHEIKIDQWTFRLYRYRPGYRCPESDQLHQFVLGPGQKKKPGTEWGEHKLDPSICKFFHLNGVRSGIGTTRIQRNASGQANWRGSGKIITADIAEISTDMLPRSIREYIKKTGKNFI